MKTEWKPPINPFIYKVWMHFETIFIIHDRKLDENINGGESSLFMEISRRFLRFFILFASSDFLDLTQIESIWKILHFMMNMMSW